MKCSHAGSWLLFSQLLLELFFAQLALEPCQLGLIGFEAVDGLKHPLPSDRGGCEAWRSPHLAPTIEPEG